MLHEIYPEKRQAVLLIATVVAGVFSGQTAVR
jgi:hypothetical protein